MVSIGDAPALTVERYGKISTKYRHEQIQKIVTYETNDKTNMRTCAPEQTPCF